MWPLPEAVEASVHFVYNCLVLLQTARKLPVPLASALPLLVSLPIPTEQLTVWQGGLTQLGAENCACLAWRRESTCHHQG